MIYHISASEIVAIEQQKLSNGCVMYVAEEDVFERMDMSETPHIIIPRREDDMLSSTKLMAGNPDTRVEINKQCPTFYEKLMQEIQGEHNMLHLPHSKEIQEVCQTIHP